MEPISRLPKALLWNLKKEKDFIIVNERQITLSKDSNGSNIERTLWKRNKQIKAQKEESLYSNYQAQTSLQRIIIRGEKQIFWL